MAAPRKKFEDKAHEDILEKKIDDRKGTHAFEKKIESEAEAGRQEIEAKRQAEEAKREEEEEKRQEKEGKRREEEEAKRHEAEERRESGAKDQAKKSARSAIYGSIFMAVVLAINVIYIVATGQLKPTFDVLHDLNLNWLFLSMGAMVGYLLLGTLAYVFAALLDNKGKEGIFDLVSVEAAGTFYGNLTPMMVGSLPAQIWRLIKAGLRFGEATAVQIIRFSIYQLAQVLLAAVLLICTWNDFSIHYVGLLWLNFIMFVLKLAQLAILVAIAFFPNWVTKITGAFFAFSKKHRISFLEKHVDAWDTQIKEEVGKFKTAFKTSFKKPRKLLYIMLASLGQISILYISPWIIMQAFSVQVNFWEAFTAGTMVQFVSSSIPLPGGTGGIEASFIAYFNPYLGALTVPVYLVWRLVTYYGYTVFTGLASNLYTKPTSPTLEQRLAKLRKRKS